MVSNNGIVGMLDLGVSYSTVDLGVSYSSNYELLVDLGDFYLKKVTLLAILIPKKNENSL